MSKQKRFSAVDFSSLSSEHVQRLLKELYDHGMDEQREIKFGQSEDRRQKERRQENKFVLLDTRSSHSRRKSGGRRTQDENNNNKYKVGIDYYI